MAVDTRDKRASVPHYIWGITLPQADGDLDGSDRAVVSYMYAGVGVVSAITTLVNDFAREPTLLVTITLPGTASPPQIFRFSPKLGAPLNLQLGLDVRPYLLSFSGRPTKIAPDRSITERARVSLTFADDENAPDFDSGSFIVFKGGSFWRRFVVAQPDFVGAVLEVARGFVSVNFPLTSFVTIFKGRIEEADFGTETVTVVAKDDLALSDIQVPADISDNNVISAMSVDGNTIAVTRISEITDPATLGSKDFFPVILRIEPDSIPFPVVSGAWTVTTPPLQLTETGAFTGYTFVSGDKIFLSEATIADGLFEIDSKISNDAIKLKTSISGSDIPSGVVGEALEDIAIESVATNAITARNELAFSEDMTNGVWVKTAGTTVAGTSEVGPFGATGRPDLLSFASIGDEISQDTGFDHSSVADRTFALWLKTAPGEIVDGKITIQIESDDGSENITKKITLTNDWTRQDVSQVFALTTKKTVVKITRQTGDDVSVLIAHPAVQLFSTRTFYMPNAGTVATTRSTGRGAFGTKASVHSTGRPFKEVVHYRQHLDPVDGVHPVIIMRDLVSRGRISDANVDVASFNEEFNFISSSVFKRTGVTLIEKPRKLSEHVRDVRAQALLDIWMSETGLVQARLSYRLSEPGITPFEINDEDNIVFRSSSYKSNKQSRVTRVFVYHSPFTIRDAEKPEDFQNVQVTADLAVEAISGPKARSVFSKWIFRVQEASALAGRILRRFRRGARLATWTLEMKDMDDFNLGDIITLDSTDILVASGNSAIRADTFWQITKRQFFREEGTLKVEALEEAGGRYATITPSGHPDYPASTALERTFGYIGDSSNLLAETLITAPFSPTSMAWTASTKRLTETAAFAGYTFTAGDHIFLSHSSIDGGLGFFAEINSKISDDVIDLVKSIFATDLTGVTTDNSKFRTDLVEGFVIL